MKAPPFWWREDPTLGARILSPAGHLVGAIAIRRLARPGAVRLGIPVVCVGNPTVGGSGKTPVGIAIADALAAAGHTPVFLTRGYGGRLRGPVRVAPEHTAADVGDEPLLLAERAPTLVARDRGAGGLEAARHGDVVVMDDGFQNPALAKDFAVLVLDAAMGLGNACVTPAGPLRAPFEAQAKFAHALILTQTGEASAPMPATTLPVHRVKLLTTSPVSLAGARVLAFAGIGRPQKFFHALEDLGADLVEARPLGDHAPLSEQTAQDILSAAKSQSLTIVTTAKDLMRLAGRGPAANALAAQAVRVEVRAELPPALVDALLAACRTTA